MTTTERMPVTPGERATPNEPATELTPEAIRELLDEGRELQRQVQKQLQPLFNLDRAMTLVLK